MEAGLSDILLAAPELNVWFNSEAAIAAEAK